MTITTQSHPLPVALIDPQTGGMETIENNLGLDLCVSDSIEGNKILLVTTDTYGHPFGILLTGINNWLLLRRR
jgi:hypothetical protein